MKKLLAICAVMVLIFAFSGLASAQPTIDGTISPGEWDAYFLGTSTTDFGGGTSVDVYGFADDTYLYVAYVADTSEPGWALACTQNINGNFYFKTPQNISWPEEGYTILEMVYTLRRLMHTDGTNWDEAGAVGLDSVPGLEYAYIDMYEVDDADCASGTTNNNVAEFKIPLSELTYAGDDGLMLLFGQYWDYNFSDAFTVFLFNNLGQCIKALVKMSCTDLTGTLRKDCVHAQQGACQDYFGVPSAHAND